MSTLQEQKKTVDCRYWSDCGTLAGGCCALARFGGKPSLGTCGGCIARGENRASGAGDTIAAVLNATGAGAVVKSVIETATGKPCGCAKRQAALNRLLPYSK